MMLNPTFAASGQLPLGLPAVKKRGLQAFPHTSPEFADFRNCFELTRASYCKDLDSTLSKVCDRYRVLPVLEYGTVRDGSGIRCIFCVISFFSYIVFSPETQNGLENRVREFNFPNLTREIYLR